MKVVLIDNGTTLLEKLRILIPGEEMLVHFTKFDVTKISDANLVILSGSNIGPLIVNEAVYRNEIDFIQNTHQPIIGICFGHELLAYAHDATLKELPQQEHGITAVEVVKDQDIFCGRKSFEVYENHRWGIDVLPDSFEVLAKSDHSPEIIRHKRLPFYGFQFHPENYVEESFGDEVFLNVFRKLVD